MSMNGLPNKSVFELLFETYGVTMTPVQVADVIGCHPTHVRALCQSGELPGIKIGERWFIPTIRLAAVLEGEDK